MQPIASRHPSHHPSHHPSYAPVGVALLIVGVAALAFLVPVSILVTGPALALGGVHLIRTPSEPMLRALGVVAAALGLLLTAFGALAIMGLLRTPPPGVA
jgi:hypothetical protein